MTFELIIFIAELVGTAAFAVSGVLLAAEKELDLLGAIILGATTAVGGGIIRDIILGKLPPTTFIDPTYAIVAVAVSLIVFVILFFFGKKINLTSYLNIINAFDAVGLAIFVVVGVNAAYFSGYSDNIFLSSFVGVMTGVGGGVLRDMLVGKIPVILRKKIYAVAAIFGAVLYCLLLNIGTNNSLASLFSCAVIIIIRMLATRFNWSLPKLPPPAN